jgi:dienelactone hydrolase
VSKVKNTLISALAIGLLAGSAVGVAAQIDDEPSSASTGCEEPLAEPGVYDGVNDFEDAQQAYRVVVPEGYADLSPAPLILNLATGRGFLDPAFEMWSAYLDPAESIFVTAELTHWAHWAPATLVALIDQLVVEYCVDPRQVHAMGWSFSSPIVGDLACAAPDRIASFYGGMGSFSPKCDSPRPVPLISLTGNGDRELVSRSVEAWAENNGCDPEPVEEDLGSGVTRKEYQGCEADVVLYDVEGAGHGLIRQGCIDNRGDYCIANDVFDQLRELERFFAEHPLEG